MATPAPRHLVVTVHGTWGRGVTGAADPTHWSSKVYWWHHDSAFAADLRREMVKRGLRADLTEIIPFAWSGANSIRARARAADDFATWLARERAARGNPDTTIIAHSHGGNVIRKAVISTTDALNVVTLATPFAEIAPDDEFGPGPANGVRFALIALAAAILFVLLVLLDLFTGEVASTWLSRLDTDTVGGQVLAFYLVIGFFLLAIFLVQLVRLDPEHRPVALTAATAGGMDWSGMGASRLLVLRGINDEADLALAAGLIGNGLSLGITRVIGGTISFLMTFAGFIVTMALTTLFFLALAQGLLPEDILPENGAAFFMAVAVGTGLACLALILLSGLFKSVFGRELVFGSLNAGLNTQSVPDIRHNVTVQTLPPAPRGTGLRHSLYAHPGCAAAIAAFMYQAASSPANPRSMSATVSATP